MPTREERIEELRQAVGALRERKQLAPVNPEREVRRTIADTELPLSARQAFSAINPIGRGVEELTGVKLTPGTDENLQLGDVTKLLANIGAGIPSAVGAAFGSSVGPGGTVGGALAGSLAGGAALDAAQQKFPELLGESGSSNLFEFTGNKAVDFAIEDTILNAGTAGLARAVPKGGAGLKGLLGSVASAAGKELSPAARKSLKQLEKEGFELPLTAGSTRNSLAEMMESLFTPKQKAAIIKEQQGAIADGLERATGIPFEGIPSKVFLRGRAKDAAMRALTLTTDNIVQAEKVFLDSIEVGLLDGVPVQGVTNMFRTTEKFRPIFSRLQKLRGGVSQAEAASRLATDPYEQAFNVLESLLKERIGINKKSIPSALADFDAVRKETRRLKGIGEDPILVRQFEDLGKTIEKDIVENSGLSIEQVRQFNHLKNMKEVQEELLPQDVRAALQGETNDFFDKVLNNAESAKNFIEATGPEGKEVAKAEILSRFFELHTKEVEGEVVFDSRRALHDFNSRNNEGLGVLVQGDQRNKIRNFLRVSSEVSPKLVETGRAALGFRASNAVIGFTAGVLGGSLATASVKTGGSTLALIYGAKKFTEKVLLDRRRARIATGLLKTPPSTKRTSKEVLSILGALRGVKATVVQFNADGSQVNLGEITTPENIEDLQPETPRFNADLVRQRLEALR